MGRLDLPDKWRDEDEPDFWTRDLTPAEDSSSLSVREGDTGPLLESPQPSGGARDSEGAGRAVFNIGHVAGGTHSGWKRPFNGDHLPWLCDNCGKITNPGYRVQCTLCGARRPT